MEATCVKNVDTKILAKEFEVSWVFKHRDIFSYTFLLRSRVSLGDTLERIAVHTRWYDGAAWRQLEGTSSTLLSVNALIYIFVDCRKISPGIVTNRAAPKRSAVSGRANNVRELLSLPEWLVTVRFRLRRILSYTLDCWVVARSQDRSNPSTILHFGWTTIVVEAKGFQKCGTCDWKEKQCLNVWIQKTFETENYRPFVSSEKSCPPTGLVQVFGYRDNTERVTKNLQRVPHDQISRQLFMSTLPS